MARQSINISLGGSLGNGDIMGAAIHGIPSTVDTVAAAAASDALALLIVTAQGTADVSDTAAKATQTAAAAAQTGIVATTPMGNAINAVKAYTVLNGAIAACKAGPDQSTADAVDAAWSTAVTGMKALIDAMDTLWGAEGGFEAQILALDGLINATKNASDTGATYASNAKTAAGDLDTDDIDTNLTAHGVDEAMDVVLDYNDVTVTKDSLRQVMTKILERIG